MLEKQKIPFSKPAKSIDQQFEILKSRGLDISNVDGYEELVKRTLLHNNYGSIQKGVGRPSSIINSG